MTKKMTLLKSISSRLNYKMWIQKKRSTQCCVLLLILFLINTIVNETMSTTNNSNESTTMFHLFGFKNFLNNISNKERPFVSFIIPSLLRSTLPQTLDSLTLQTDPNWEALIGVDLDILSPLPNQGMEEESSTVTASDTTLPVEETPPNSDTNNPPPITTTDNTIDTTALTPSSSSTDANKMINDGRISLSMMRNMSHVSNNSAGAVRNRLMPEAKGEWIAFVDDDDTISPCYVEWLKRGLQKLEKEYNNNNNNVMGGGSQAQQMPEVIVFRMYLPVLRKDVPFRKGRSKNVIQLNNVGISFAVKSELMKEKGFAFEPGSGEDYQLLRSLHIQGHRIMIADCTAYFVHAEKWDPNQRTCTQKRESTCHFIDPKNVVV